MADEIHFVVPGQVQQAPAAGTALRGLRGQTVGAVRVGARRGAGDQVRLSARVGEDMVVLSIANGPTLVLHPHSARDLMLAQGGSPARGAEGDAVAVPAQLGWAGLETAAATRGATRGWLGEVLLSGFDIVRGALDDKAVDLARAAATARLDGRVEAGVYELSPDELKPLKGSGRLRARLPASADGGPLLVLVHGTFVDTVSTFGALWTQHPEVLQRLFAHYGGRVHALDHPTMGQSPIANALTLVRALPDGARLHLLTHSRGGLVAEVLARACAAPLGDDDLAFFPETSHARHRQELQALVAEAQAKRLQVERVLRVACPSRGTLLASGRLDAYLSVLKWGLDLAGVPVLPELVDFLGEVARRRSDPAELPGLEAMTPDSPVVQWLNAGGEPVPGQLRVLAGDIEGDSVLSWVKTLLADAFYWTDNDLVVQTRSMYGGSPRAASGASFVLERGAKVSHFNYFANERSVQAVESGLTEAAPAGFRLIGPLSWAGQDAGGTRAARALQRSRGADAEGRPAAARPAVVLLPGILGSNLALDGRRIWLGLRVVGGLKKLAWDPATAAHITPDGAIGLSYDHLIEHLAATHEVIEFSYDWRRPVEDEARRLATVVDDALARRSASGQPVRLLAHSMGGLVARTLQLEAPDTWRRLMNHDGARLLMLGTPNAGSWAPMQVLSGDDTFGNTLVAFGGLFDDAGTRRIMAGMPGFIQLQAALTDPTLKLDRAEEWQRLADEDLRRLKERSRWHADERQLRVYAWSAPPQAVLDQAVALRRRLDQQAAGLGADAQKMLLVVGHDQFTPAGYRVGDEGLEYLDAPDGDGRVPLASALLPGVRTWRCEATHGKLADQADAFAAYDELLALGDTTLLPRLDSTALRGAAGTAERVPSRPSRGKLPSQPPSAPFELFARDAAAVPLAGGAQLPIVVLNGNLKFIQAPLMLGHYQSGSLTGTEYVVNLLTGGLMADSLNAGRYPAEPGSAQVFVNTRVDPEQPWSLPRPAAVVVVGLGEEGRLRAADLQRSVRQGVIAFAQREKEQRGATGFELAATLIGSGGVGIHVGTAAQAIAQGVAAANRRLARSGWPQVTQLQLIELYLDRATEAHNALAMLAESRPQDYALAPTVASRTGALRRPSESGYRGAGYDFINAVQRNGANGQPVIEFTLDTQRARTEVRGQATQPRLVDEMVRIGADAASTDLKVRRSLFQLLVPVEIEPFLAGCTAVVLQLDTAAARFPWELLDAGPGDDGRAADDAPWAVRTQVIRKLRTEDFRERPVGAGRDGSVLVIGEPQCDPALYAELPAARDEAQVVARTLSAAALINPDALAVVNALLDEPRRIVHIAGHGEHRDDGSGGVILTHGAVLGPREIGAMRTVPELVFINCCFLGQVKPGSDASANALGESRTRFAAGVAEQLIRNGVRCVVAAGWAVEDVPAMRFAARFYERLLAGDRFIDAVGEARRAAWEANRRGNTWAAYQCYGDPDWRYADPAEAQAAAVQVPTLVSAPALALWLENQALDARYAIPSTGPDARRRDARRRRERVQKLDKMQDRYAPLWGGMGAVAEAFGLAYADAGEIGAAIAWYRRAHEAADGSASIKASEQLGNLLARGATEAAQVDEAITLLQQLVDLRPTAERHSLLGSAYKRLALLSAARASDALLQSAAAYEAAEHAARAAGARDLHYPLVNVMAVRLRLALLQGGDTQAALDGRIDAARASLQAAATHAPDFWSVVGLVELQLLQAVAEGHLASAAAGVREGFAEVADRVPAPHLWRSVRDQSHFVLDALLQARGTAAADARAAESILKQVDRLAALPSEPQPSEPQPKAPLPNEPQPAPAGAAPESPVSVLPSARPPAATANGHGTRSRRPDAPPAAPRSAAPAAGATPAAPEAPGAARDALVPEADAVDAAVYCPPRVPRGASFLVQVFLHLPAQAQEVAERALETDADARRRQSFTLPLDVPAGTRVDIRLEMPGLTVNEPDAFVVWRRRVASVQFQVDVPAAAADRVLGQVRFAIAGAPAGTMRFQLDIGAVGQPAAAAALSPVEAVRYRRAFASYASKDRAEVLRRVQAFKIAGIEVFQDVLDLSPGERWEPELYRRIDDCDVFLLFWSTAASQSAWVGKEIDYALQRKGGVDGGLPAIQPVPIEGPPIVPPPASLQSLHFNDALLAHISVADAARPKP